MAQSQASSSSSYWTTWAVIGTASTVAVAGLSYLGYMAYQSWQEGEKNSSNMPSLDDAARSARLRLAKSIQMQTMLPTRVTPASRSTPNLPARNQQKPNQAASSKASTSAAAPAKLTNGSAAPNNRKVCAECHKPIPAGLPLRCSGCKMVYYCSQSCQRKAWPEHKAVCKASSKSAHQSTDGAANKTQQQKEAPAANGAEPVSATAKVDAESSGSNQPADSQETPKETEIQAKSEQSEEPQSLQDALAKYLEQNAASKSDQLEAKFEMAVMLFVKAEYRAAIAQLGDVQEMAKEKGNVGVQGEVFKWLGHAHNRLADTAAAEAMFSQGIEFARVNKLERLEIDCLGGLGCLYRAQNNAVKSVETLEAALKLCERTGDEDSKAATLCNLGSALMPTDPQRGLKCLHEAVNIRELAIERLHDAGERSGLATAVMEHANAMVNLASALLITKRLPEAEACYVRALEVFELIEDVDKVVKVLINLANMKELQVGSAEARAQARDYRVKLLQFMESHGVRRVDTQCSVCLENINMKEVTSSTGQELILLSCLHCLHNKCWEGWMRQHEDGVVCPTCKQPVPVFAVDT